MVRLVENERSWAIELISEINNYLSSVNLNIEKAGGETTINNSRSTDGQVALERAGINSTSTI